MKRIIVAGLMLFASAAFAQANPECTDHGRDLAVNNGQVLGWKQTTQEQFHGRAHIQGTLRQIFPDHSGHHHLEVSIGPKASDLIEVIYNEDFGTIPQLQIGMTVEACGDYITARVSSGQYPASPDGAIVHWVHKSPSPRHDSGYLMLGTELCGQNDEDAGPKPGYGD